ncbi:MAG: response regulator [Oceanospirillaceae bacterium]|nr:response regulator [Oceanospirillaceae bacterium]
MNNNSVLVAQLETMYPQVKFLFMGVAALTLVIVNIFWDKVELITLISWASISTLLIIIRAFFLIYSKNNLNLNNARMHASLFALGSLISGFIWASASFIFLDINNTISLIVIVTLLMGSTAGALVTLSAYLPAFYGYSISVLIPLAWLLIDQPRSEIAQIGYLVVIYLMALIGYSHAVNRNLKQFIALRFNNQVLLKDLTKQRDIAEQANIEKSRYLAATSHDLRQPLHALQLYLGNLETLDNTSQQQLLITKSITAGTTLNKLLSALMDVSRLDSGEVALNMQSVALEDIIGEIAQEFQPKAELHDIQFLVTPLAVNVFSDPLLLGRCIRNLVDNAFAHANAQKIIINTSLEAQNLVKISINDNGIGIKESEKDSVFSEFYQLKNPERDRNKGLGLGLAIVKKLTKLMGHELQLTCAEGQGSQFSITLAASDLLPSSKLIPAENLDVSGLFVVMVDDDPDICEGMSLTLKRWGCEVIICNDTQQLIDELNRLNYTAPDIIIADYRLRENLTGVETIKQVRALFNQEIPAILMSGDTGETVIKESAGIKCLYQQKPVSVPDLKQLIVQMTNSDI